MNERPLAAACAACDEDLSAWIDGELDERRTREMSRHVAGCARCRPRSETLHAVDGALRALSDAPLSGSEAARLERVRDRLATWRREERAAEIPLDRPALVVASAGSPRTSAPPPQRRRGLLAKSFAAVAAIALAVLVVPGLLERTAGRAPGPGDGLAPRAEGIAREDRVARQVAEPSERTPAATVPRPKPLTPGHLGASAPADPVAEAGDDGVAAPSDFTADFDVADLPLVERLDALEALPRVGELPSAERQRLAERLDPLRAEATADRERLRGNFERWRAKSPAQREALRERWRGFQAATAAERERLLRGEPPTR